MSLIHLEGPVAVVRTPGRFGFAADEGVAAELDRTIAQGARGVVFDLTETMMLTSAGVRVIVQTACRPQMKGRVRAVAADPQTAEVLKLVRIDLMVPIHPTVESAVAACLAAGA